MTVRHKHSPYACCATAVPVLRAAKNARPEADPPNLLPVLRPEETQPLRIVNMRPVGNYAYCISFSDGHDTGIYTLEFLRQLGDEHPPTGSSTAAKGRSLGGEALSALRAPSPAGEGSLANADSLFAGEGARRMADSKGVDPALGRGDRATRQLLFARPAAELQTVQVLADPRAASRPHANSGFRLRPESVR